MLRLLTISSGVALNSDKSLTVNWKDILEKHLPDSHGLLLNHKNIKYLKHDNIIK